MYGSVKRGEKKGDDVHWLRWTWQLRMITNEEELEIVKAHLLKFKIEVEVKPILGDQVKMREKLS